MRALFPVIVGLGSLGIAGAAPAAPFAGDEPLNLQSFRVVTRDGDLHVGALQFTLTTFQTVKPSARGGPAEEQGRGGRGGRGAGLGGFMGGLGMLANLADTALERDLSWIDRIERDDQVVFRANRQSVISLLLTEEGYAGGYGGLACGPCEALGWSAARIDEQRAVFVRRDKADEIVGVFRLGIHRYGDGASTSFELETDGIEPDELLRKIDRDRFSKIDRKAAASIPLADDLSVFRAERYGREIETQVNLYAETNIFERGPFLPRVDILVRGPEWETLLAEAHQLLETVRFTRDEPAPPRSFGAGESPFGGRRGEGGGGRDGGQRGGRGGGMFASLFSQPLEAGDSAFLAAGKYVNPDLGVEFKAPLPKEWMFVRADERGLLALLPPADGRGFEVAGVSLTFIDGVLAVADPAAWLAERYLAPGTEGKAPKLKKTRVGAHPGYWFETEEAGRSKTLRQRFFVEDRGRTLVIVTFAIGSGTGPEKMLKALPKWLKSLKLTSKKG